jgi:hypothetical protein
MNISALNNLSSDVWRMITENLCFPKGQECILQQVQPCAAEDSAQPGAAPA